MAHENIEVEIKIPLPPGEFSRVRKELERTSELKRSSSEVDTYFVPAHRDFLKNEYPSEWLRLGIRGGKAILNYKHWRPDNAETKTHCDEFETVVGSQETLRKILRALDFRELVTVEKERVVFVHGDSFEVALDDVKGLGCFIEIEALKDLGGVTATREKLFEFAAGLGIDAARELEDKRGYPYQLMKKKGLL
ncbi:MAG TPA: class IV adenylate cyclase [archaeon]|nr:class IV adenylate cyclase [archaeon]